MTYCSIYYLHTWKYICKICTAHLRDTSELDFFYRHLINNQMLFLLWASWHLFRVAQLFTNFKRTVARDQNRFNELHLYLILRVERVWASIG
jgi:hypothetical protein